MCISDSARGSSVRNILLYLCDPDAAYMRRMDSYIRHREYSPFIVRTYTSVEALAQEDEPPGVLLISSACFGAVHSALGHWHDRVRTSIVFLDEGGTLSKTSDIDSGYTGKNAGSYGPGSGNCGWDGECIDLIGKYQPAGKIYEHLLNVCAARGDFLIQPEKARNCAGRLIGVYSPENKRLQRDYAWSEARRLSDKERGLYLSLEEFLFGGGHGSGLSDLIFAIKDVMRRDDRSEASDKELLAQLFPEKCISREGSLDVIPPAACPYDLEEIGAEEWYFWLDHVLKSGRYDVIVLSFGSAVPGLCLLELCSEIYMPALPEDEAVCHSFKDTLTFMGRQAIADKIQLAVLTKPDGV